MTVFRDEMLTRANGLRQSDTYNDSIGQETPTVSSVIEEITPGVGELLSKLRSLADRVSGPQPHGVPAKPPNAPTTILGRLADMHALLAECWEEVSRLERTL